MTNRSKDARGQCEKRTKILFRKSQEKKPFRRRIWNDINGIVWESVEGIHMSQDKDRWRALVNMVMEFLIIGCELIE